MHCFSHAWVYNFLVLRILSFNAWKKFPWMVTNNFQLWVIKFISNETAVFTFFKYKMNFKNYTPLFWAKSNLFFPSRTICMSNMWRLQCSRPSICRSVPSSKIMRTSSWIFPLVVPIWRKSMHSWTNWRLWWRYFNKSVAKWNWLN